MDRRLFWSSRPPWAAIRAANSTESQPARRLGDPISHTPLSQRCRRPTRRFHRVALSVAAAIIRATARGRVALRLYHQQEHDPAGHVPGVYFAFECLLCHQLFAALLERGAKPIHSLPAVKVLADGELEQSRFMRPSTAPSRRMRSKRPTNVSDRRGVKLRNENAMSVITG